MDEEDKDKEILDVFRKVAVNISLLDVIKQALRYAKTSERLYALTRRD